MIQSIAGLSDPIRMKAPKPAGEELYTKTSGSKTSYFMSPADFATIYDLGPVYAAGNTGGTVGAGKQRVAILGADGANQSDIDLYTKTLGLPPADIRTFNVNAPNANPANDVENTEDAERVIGTAPGVGVDFILIDTGSNVYFNIVSFNAFKLRDPVLTMSVGCARAGSIRASKRNSIICSRSARWKGSPRWFLRAIREHDAEFPSGIRMGKRTHRCNALCASSYVTLRGRDVVQRSAKPSAILVCDEWS